MSKASEAIVELIWENTKAMCDEKWTKSGVVRVRRALRNLGREIGLTNDESLEIEKALEIPTANQGA